MLHPDLPGATQMAIDEALYRLAEPGTTPVLRFYTWKTPTLSLGFFQQYKRVVYEPFVLHNKIHVVRRITGGRAVLHDREMTYALAGPLENVFGNQSLQETYRCIARALNRALQGLGIDQPSIAQQKGEGVKESRLPQCFVTVSPYEISHKDTRKIIGSAQKRSRDRFLQHGSILLDFNQKLQSGCIQRPDPELAAKVAPLYQTLERQVPFEELARQFANAFEQQFQIVLQPSALSPAEQELAENLETIYKSEDWTVRGCR